MRSGLLHIRLDRQRNTVRGSGSHGLRLGFGTAYRENVITDNTTGMVSAGVNMGGNSSAFSTTCP
ncbi:MAG: hypothetical protein JRJ58_13685 [Deltaproteobacteria bacterium]|nr:hypothetical protein [Deltaproteobacteria bacterium]